MLTDDRPPAEEKSHVMNRAAKSILVTGGAGFLGTFVVEKLRLHGYQNIHLPRSQQYDLRDASAVRRVLDDTKPNIIIHLAAVVGGIGANQANPARFFFDNAMMGLQLMEYAYRAGVQKFVQIGTICAYPKFTPIPFKEDDLWNGYPEETNAPYGLAKKMLLVQAQAYRAQYGFNVIYLLPVNLYGPADNFDLETSHVIPAIIRKCVEAKEQGLREVVLWGDGSPTREFLYVDDAAEGILLAMEQYDQEEPVNLGSGVEIAIRDLAALIAAEVGYLGKITWDATKPNGQPRRSLDVTRAKTYFGFEARTSLESGILKTIAWFLKNRP